MEYKEKRFFANYKTTAFLITLVFFGISTVLFSSGCSEKTSPAINKPVPLGDKQALEKLATTYQALSDKLMVSPYKLRPQDKRQFIEQVFENAGYNYKSTLLTLTPNGFDSTIQLHRDLVELILLPQSGVKTKELSSFYSQSEIKEINTLLDKLN